MNYPFIKHIRRAGKSALAAVLAAALLTATTAPLHATEAGAKANAARILHILEGAGWNVRDNYTIGFLAKGASTVVQTTLQAGNTYRIVAAGSEDARDLDVFIYDENGNLIGKDNDTSTVSVVDIAPKWTGTFYIKVLMYDSIPAGSHFIIQYAYK